MSKTKQGAPCLICMETLFFEDVNGFRYDPQARCCGAKICLTCWRNDLCQFCPICERDQLTQECLVCEASDRVNKMHTCDCGQWIHNTCADFDNEVFASHVDNDCS